MDLFPGEPFTVLVRNFEHRAVHVPKHTVVGLALPSPTHILTIGVAAPGEGDTKEGRGSKNNSSTATEEQAQREGTATDEERSNSSTAGNVCDVKDPYGRWQKKILHRYRRIGATQRTGFGRRPQCQSC